MLRPAAFEIRGEVVARPVANLILVRHDAVPGLDMGAMELMTVFAEPALLDASGIRPGDRIRVTVRPRDGELIAVAIEALR